MLFLFVEKEKGFERPLRKHAGGERWERASGGYSDLSEWQRSERDDGVFAKDIRREPQQDLFLGRGKIH